MSSARKGGRVNKDARPTLENVPVGTDVDLRPEGGLSAEDQAVAEEEASAAESADPVSPKHCADCGSRSVAVTTRGIAGAATNYCEKCRPANLS